MEYNVVIGLEIHAELLTRTKIFCACKNDFGGRANTRVCPVCMGMPASLPVLNKNAFKKAVQAGLVLGCKVNNYSYFDRKNYFYPDLPKGYQITQFYHPVCVDGSVVINNKEFKIKQIHLEEDAGKLLHNDNSTYIDFNRCGVPLIEIVTQPDFSNSSEVCDFVKEITERFKYADICDAKLEEGSLRVDVNISLNKSGDEWGKRAEIKNLNSLKSIKRAIEYEIKRQSELLDEGRELFEETRRYDEDCKKTYFMRKKAKPDQYRYFPEPDMMGVHISDGEINKIKDELPMMPYVKREIYTKEYGLTIDEADNILYNKDFSLFFDEAAGYNKEYKETANIMLGELNKNLNSKKISVNNLDFTPKMLSELVSLYRENKISKTSLKEIFNIMFLTGKKAYEIAVDEDLMLKEDIDEIIKISKEVIENNTDNVKKYKDGKSNLLSFFVGEVKKQTPKGTNPQRIMEIIKELLDKED